MRGAKKGSSLTSPATKKSWSILLPPPPSSLQKLRHHQVLRCPLTNWKPYTGSHRGGARATASAEARGSEQEARWRLPSDSPKKRSRQQIAPGRRSHGPAGEGTGVSKLPYYSAKVFYLPVSAAAVIRTRGIDVWFDRHICIAVQQSG